MRKQVSDVLDRFHNEDLDFLGFKPLKLVPAYNSFISRFWCRRCSHRFCPCHV